MAVAVSGIKIEECLTRTINCAGIILNEAGPRRHTEKRPNWERYTIDVCCRLQLICVRKPGIIGHSPNTRPGKIVIGQRVTNDVSRRC